MTKRSFLKTISESSTGTQLTVDPLNISGYAVGATVIHTGADPELCWAQIIGTKIVEQPVCLEGINLLLELWKLLQHLERRDALPESATRDSFQIVIHTRSLADLSDYAMVRWRQYGHPYDPIPGHASLNALLAQITH